MRRKGQYASRSFRLKSDAEAWAVDVERTVNLGKSPDAVSVDDKTTFAALIKLRIKDLTEVGKRFFAARRFVWRSSRMTSVA